MSSLYDAPPPWETPSPPAPRPPGTEDDDVVDAEVIEDPDEPEQGPGGELVPLIYLDLLRMADPLALAAVVRGLREQLRARTAVLMATARTQRGTEGRPSPAWLLAEAQAAATAHEVLDRLAAVLLEARRDVDAMAVEAMTEVLGQGRRSVTVPTGHGGEIKVSVSTAQTTSVDEPVVLDIAAAAATLAASTEQRGDPAYADGITDGITALRGLLGATLPWKTSALTALATALLRADEPALASRLEDAWARVDRGDPAPKVTVTEAPPTGGPA